MWVIINADKVVLTSNKAQSKQVHRHSGYPGGLHSESYGTKLARCPDDAVRDTIRGMLPKTRLGPGTDSQAQGLCRPHPSTHRPEASTICS